MNVPIVLAAFGTTIRTKEMYGLLERRVSNRFPGHDLRWAFTSRRVRAADPKNACAVRQAPLEALEALYAQGHRWAVVQSLHLVEGHEFDRMIEEIRNTPIRTSIGLPLLSSYGDYWKVAQAMRHLLGAPGTDEAVVLIGHGTDHPAWSAYLALESIFRQRFGPHVFVGLIEGKPGKTATVHAVRKAGYRQALLIPFMLVAGMHFREDIMGKEEGWAAAFMNAGIEIRVDTSGIGHDERIIDIFLDHIEEAMDVIPDATLH